MKAGEVSDGFGKLRQPKPVEVQRLEAGEPPDGFGELCQPIPAEVQPPEAGELPDSLGNLKKLPMGRQKRLGDTRRNT